MNAQTPASSKRLAPASRWLIVIGLGVALASVFAMVFSGVGYQLGLWHFRAGFAIMGWAFWFAAGAAFYIYVRGNDRRWFAFAVIVAVTTPHTGRSPNDKFVVKEPSSERDIDWGSVNVAMVPDKFDLLLADAQKYLNGLDELFVQVEEAAEEVDYQQQILRPVGQLLGGAL